MIVLRPESSTFKSKSFILLFNSSFQPLLLSKNFFHQSSYFYLCFPTWIFMFPSYFNNTHEHLLYATLPFLLSGGLETYLFPGFIHQDNLAHESPHCLYSHDKPWGALLHKQVQAIFRLWGWTFLLLLSLCQVHPPLSSSHQQSVKYENTSSTTRKQNRRNTSLLIRLSGLLQGPASPSAPLTTTITDLQCLVAAVFHCLFTPDFLQSTGQPPASQDPYDFSTFRLATHLHYRSATVQDIIQIYLFIFSYSL